MKKNLIMFLLCFFLCGVCTASSIQEEWKEKKSQHFFVYYQNTPEDFVELVLDTAEDYYDQITGDLGFRRRKGWSFKDRAKIYIYDNQQHYVSSANQSSWSAGAAYYRRRSIRTYPSASGFFDSLLPHELGHIIFHEFVGTEVSIPSWFSEGVAMYQEKAKQLGSHEQVRQAIEDGTFIPLPQLHHMRLNHKSSRDKVNLFYAESASVVYYLIKEKGSFRFTNFCRQLRNGNKFLHAFELAYNNFNTLERLNESWVSYLERK